MNIKVNSTTANNVAFQKLYVKKGAFQALKSSENFPIDSYEQYPNVLLDFYKKLKNLKKSCENNTSYNVVIKPNKTSGKIVIENADGKEQTGFTTEFENILNIDSKLLTHKNTLTSFFLKSLKNLKIDKFKNLKDIKELNLQEYLDILYKRIEIITRNADSLAEWQNIKQMKGVENA